jgi:hypothetical protein
VADLALRILETAHTHVGMYHAGQIAFIIAGVILTVAVVIAVVTLIRNRDAPVPSHPKQREAPGDTHADKEFPADKGFLGGSEATR